LFSGGPNELTFILNMVAALRHFSSCVDSRSRSITSNSQVQFEVDVLRQNVYATKISIGQMF